MFPGLLLFVGSLAAFREASLNSSSSDELPLPLQNIPIYSEKLNLALLSALAAGRAMRESSSKSQTTSTSNLKIKSTSTTVDFATEVDLANEKMIMSNIKSSFPADLIIGEEGSEAGDGYTFTTKPTWIIDPIDGTTNFVSLNKMCCCSIAYSENKQIQVACVHAPFLGETYLAIRGHGAYLNGQVIKKMFQKPLTDLNIIAEFGYERSEKSVSAMTAAMGKLLQKGCRSMRQYGSGVLDLCWVATGKCDASYTGVCGEGWKIWDYAAAGLILTECGGCLEKLTDAGDFDYTGCSMVASASPETNEILRRVVLG
jgi:fructose-1,6-bisphosphatase/inositol monophosphatase family enzyme